MRLVSIVKLLGLADGQLANIYFERRADTSWHAGAGETVACGITNGTTHGNISTARTW